jgi:hypothetical protein
MMAKLAIGLLSTLGTVSAGSPAKVCLWCIVNISKWRSLAVLGWLANSSLGIVDMDNRA